MLWGVLIGTYSSIFIAAPVLILVGVTRDEGSSARVPEGKAFQASKAQALKPQAAKPQETKPQEATPVIGKARGPKGQGKPGQPARAGRK
jgi:hypothetical protein